MFYQQANITDIVAVLERESTTSVCILDNNFISFFMTFQRHVDIETIFSTYQYILIPKWVYHEIKSSSYRTEWIMRLSLHHNIYVLDELNYSELSGYRDLALTLFLLSSTFSMVEVCELLKQRIRLRGQDIEINEVFLELYDVILPSVMGRNQHPKNAGEVSIVILANILRYYYPNIQGITIFSFDKDCYQFMSESSKQLLGNSKIKNFKNVLQGKDVVAPTFKTNDFILKELYDSGIYTDITVVKQVRKNSRIVKYVEIQQDGSIAEYQKLLDTSQFIELLQLKSIKIIF